MRGFTFVGLAKDAAEIFQLSSSATILVLMKVMQVSHDDAQPNEENEGYGGQQELDY